MCFYANNKASIGVISLASEVKLGSVEASKRQGLRDKIKKILASLEKAGKITPKIERLIKDWNARAIAASAT